MILIWLALSFCLDAQDSSPPWWALSNPGSSPLPIVDLLACLYTCLVEGSGSATQLSIAWPSPCLVSLGALTLVCITVKINDRMCFYQWLTISNEILILRTGVCSCDYRDICSFDSLRAVSRQWIRCSLTFTKSNVVVAELTCPRDPVSWWATPPLPRVTISGRHSLPYLLSSPQVALGRVHLETKMCLCGKWLWNSQVLVMRIWSRPSF